MPKAPEHLSHKPIVAVNDYDKIDAKYAKNTDVVALSIGNAQYDNANEISLKVWRKPKNKKWSRQSEELPIHRNIDLNILLVGALLSDPSAEYSMTSLREEIMPGKNVKVIKYYYEKHKHFLRPRLEELRNKLDIFFERESK